MKRILACAAAAMILTIGCSENKLTIQNVSNDVVVNLTFLAKTYRINPATTTEIPDVPNGTYGYGSIVSPLTAGQILELGDNLSGTFKFEQSSTEALLIYGSRAGDCDSIGNCPLVVWAHSSTNNPLSAITSP